jgi:hypothetical protein
MSPDSLVEMTWFGQQQGFQPSVGRIAARKLKSIKYMAMIKPPRRCRGDWVGTPATEVRYDAANRTPQQFWGEVSAFLSHPGAVLVRAAKSKLVLPRRRRGAEKD